MARLGLRGKVGLCLAICGASLSLLWVSIVRAVSFHGGIQHGCITEGPFDVASPHAVLTPAVDVRGYFSWFPLGRACEWPRTDGGGVVTALPEWGGTIVALMGIAVGLIGLGLLALSLRRSRGASR